VLYSSPETLNPKYDRFDTILGWILARWDRVMWTEFVWFRIGTGGELL
jgi:hypothetical protein